MLVCEALLISVIVTLGAYVTYTDIKNGIIQNRILLMASATGIIIQTVYLGLFYREGIASYLINLICMAVIGVCLYGFHFWAAGDSKMLATVVLLYPIRLYPNIFSRNIPGIGILMTVFGIAYLYIIADSIVCFVRKKEFYKSGLLNKENVKSFALPFFVCFLYLRLLSKAMLLVIPEFYSGNAIAFSFINIFIAMVINERKIFRKWYLLLVALILNVILSLGYKSGSISLFPYVVLALALLLRAFLSGYNYDEIKTEDVRRGMVLSLGTILVFSRSNISGLPQKTYEDMRSRLTDDEVDAINRWKRSKYGQESIVIVRKIPFAIFIFSGIVILFLGGTVLGW